MTNHHFLLLCCPAQGHVNPTLELAKLLLTHGGGATVTFATTVRGLRGITTTLPTVPGLAYASFSDGFDDGDQPTIDQTRVMSEFKRVGSQTLTHLLTTLSHGGSPVTFIIYTILLPWAAAVARDMRVPSAFFSIQSATTFAIFHTYFNKPSISIKLPGLPLFSNDDVPSFLLPESPHSSVIPTIKEHIQTLEEDPNPLILVNTFDAFEQDSIRAIDNMNVIAIGPLIQSKNSIKIDLFERSGEDYIQWLDSKPDCSVVYVSFGSMVVLEKPQIDEILKGLVQSCRPFLWVIRSEELKKNIVAELGTGNGLIVSWCSQLEVLGHPSIGCFVTHCGWNSTVESVVAGVAMVGCPVLSDQMTNAKMVEEVWGVGLRAVVNEEKVVERGEIERCLDVVMGGGERGEEIRRNVVKWKGLALEAIKEGGSSHNNFKQFLERLG
ncbi:hypothetical protein ACSBR2_012782 [Camellia fascicularis]